MFLSLRFALAILISMISFLSLSDSDSDYIQNPPQPFPDNSMNSISPPKPGWIDPFDMFGDSHTRSSDFLFVQSEVEMHILQKRCNNNELYLRRFVNMFLNAVELRVGPVNNENSLNRIKMEFLIQGKDINILKEFGRGENNAPKIELVSEVFTKIFSQKTPQDRNMFSLNDLPMWLQKAFFKIISSPEWTVLSSVFLLLFLTLWFVYHSHSYRMALFTVFLTIFLAGFGFTWIRMYEEKEVERYVNIVRNGEIPRHCSSQSQTMAWYEHMYYRMFGVDCIEFLKIRDVRPIVKISPTDVLAETITSMIVTPAKSVGKAYGDFISSLTDTLPWWLKLVGLPLGLIVPVLIFLVILAFLFNYSLSLSITGLHFIPTWSPTSRRGVREDNRYIEDCSRQGNSSSQQNSSQIPFLESNTPLFILNWMALKKLSSSNILVENSETNKGEAKRETVNEEVPSLKDDSEKMVEDLKEFEEFVESMETEKVIEERKKRSVHTCTEGDSSLSKRRNDLQKSLMNSIEYSDLPSGDRNRTSGDTEKAKDFKDKTS